MGKTITAPDIQKEKKSKSQDKKDKPWKVIVWNDHINTMSYVSYVFQKVLGLKEEIANQYMLKVHHEGLCCVAVVDREKAELYWQRLQQHGLKTTIEQSE